MKLKKCKIYYFIKKCQKCTKHLKNHKLPTKSKQSIFNKHIFFNLQINYKFLKFTNYT